MYDKEKTQEALHKVQEVIEALIDPKTGCPWDREQTPKKITEYIIEECFECIDAIRKDQVAHIVDELGDVLFQFAFLANMYDTENKFNLADALNAGAEKMIRRHPHVFADAKLETEEELVKSWAAIKKQEKLNNPESGALSSIPTNLPPLTKSYRIHAKAAGVGFTWENDEDVEQQVEAEYLELFDALQSKNQDAIKHELGDMIFSLVELGRRKGIKSAEATDESANRFLERFAHMEKMAKSRNLTFEDLSLEEKDALWEEAKKAL